MREYTLDPTIRFTPRVNDSGSAPAPAFSVGQIAATVGMSRKDVWSALRRVQPAAPVVRSGYIAPGYAFETLPDRMKSKIEQHRLDLNYRSPEAVLADPTKQWQPTTPLNQQPAAAVEVAHNLRRALSFYITNRNDVSLRPGELKQRLLSDYQAAFGKRIVPRHAVRLAEMVLLRDRGREEFDRIELYLPVSEIRNKNGETPSADFPALVDALGIVRDISALSVADRACLWKAAIDDFLALLDCGVSRVNSKRQIVSFLLGRVPGLSATRHALRVAFDAKLSAFQSQGVSGICDKRREKSGRSRIVPYTSPEALSDDEKLLLCRANSVGGGLSQAFRELHRGIEIIPGQMMQFSESFRATYGFNAREAKSHVPRSLRDKLRPLLKSIEPLNHGPKAARLAAPSIHRDWSNILAGSLFQSDDETANHYVWFQSEDGEYEFQGMRFDVLRPQILPMVDVRTDYVLSVLLLCRRQYNSRDIRSLILKTCLDERIGLPFDGFYFEGNIWQARNVLSLVNWSEIDEAFSRSGLELRLRHATTPKAKIIERIFSQEQNSMQALPGYAGRNERTDGYERVRGSLALMKRFGQPIKQEVAPWDHFLSADQYLDQLQSAYERFNAEPQNGTRLKGMSPAEAWKELAGGRAHHVVPDSLRYLLATEQREVTVSREGVRVRIGGENRYFCESDRLGTLVGEKVLVRWNQDFPDHVVVVHPKTDPMAQNPFIVRHTPLIDAVNASKEDISNARSRQKSFLDPQRSIFRMLNHQHGKTIRDELLGNFNLRLAGEAHEEAQRGEVEAKPSREARVSRARKAATRAGISPEKIKRPDRAAGLELLPDLEARILQREAQGKL